MARQNGNNYLIGTIGPVVFYKLRQGYYLRTKSSLSRKRWQKDPAFAGSRKRAEQFGEAARLAKVINDQLSRGVKRRGFIGMLTGQVHKGLLAGKSREKVVEELLEVYGMKKAKALAMSSKQEPTAAMVSGRTNIALPSIQAGYAEKESGKINEKLLMVTPEKNRQLLQSSSASDG